MTERPIRIRDFRDLAGFIHERLCQADQLEPHAFPMTHRLLVKRQRPCGVYFCLHGPRSVKYTAIWDVKKGAVLFYGSGGERFDVTQVECPEDFARDAA